MYTNIIEVNYSINICDFFLDCFLFLQENTKDKKPCELKMPHTPGKLAEARSVFENGASEKSDDGSNRKEKLFPPPKPPRVAATEVSHEEKPGEQQQAAKRKAPSPPKETKENSNGDAVKHNTTSVIKRKAPEPPTSNQGERKVEHDDSSKTTVKISVVECEQNSTKARDNQSRSSSIDEDGDGGCAPVPAKRERTGSVDSLDGINKTDGDQPTPKPRTKVQNSSDTNKKTQDENAKKESKEKEEKINGSVRKSKKTVTIVATPVEEKRSVKDNSKQTPHGQPHIIQACVVEEKAPVVAVKAVSCDSSDVKAKACREKKKKLTSVDKPEKHSRKADAPEQVFSVPAAVAVEKKTPSSSRKTRESTKKDDFAFKVPRKPTKECQFDPNETVNLNDVNIHEITFSFDFGQFDQELEKDRDSMFKMSYEEKCKQVGSLFFSFKFRFSCISHVHVPYTNLNPIFLDIP